MDTLGERINLTLDSWAGIANRDTRSINILHRTYYELFNESVQTGCGNCNQKAFLRIRKYVELNKLNLNTMATKQQLKDKKYVLQEGAILQVNFGTETYTNDNLTDEVAAKLVAENPNYKAAFSRLPDDKELQKASEQYAKQEEEKQAQRLEVMREREIETNTKVETDYPRKSGRVDDPVAAAQTEKVLIDQTEKLPTSAAPEPVKNEDKKETKAAEKSEKKANKE